MFERYLARSFVANEANLGKIRRHAYNLSERLKAIVDGTVAGNRRDGKLIEAFREAALRTSADSFRNAAQRVREPTLGLAGEALRECAGPHKAGRVDFALAVLAGAIETLTRTPQQFSDRVLRNELRAMLLASLAAGDEG